MFIQCRFFKPLLTLLCLKVMCCTAEAYVSVTEDPIGWAKRFGEATQEQRKAIYRQSVEDIARSKTGGMWDTLVNLVTRDKHLTASELLTRLNDNLHIIPNEYREAVSFVTVMKALDSLTDKETVQNNSQKVETMAKVFGVPLTMAKKLYLKQLIKSNSALAKYSNIVQAADSFITVEKANILDMPKIYEPTQSMKPVDTELVHANQKLPEAAPIPVPEISIKPENSPDVQSKQGLESKQHQPAEEKQEPKQEQTKEQIPSAKSTDSERIDRLSSELNSKNTFIRELQEKIIELEKQPKEFRPYLIEEGRKSSKENELEAQVKALRGEVSGKDYSMTQLIQEHAAKKGALDAQLTQSQRGLADAQDQNRNLQDQVDQRGHQIQDLQQDVKNRDADITRLNREHTAEKGALQTQLQTTTDQLTRSQEELSNLQGQIYKLQGQNRDLQLDMIKLRMSLVPNRREKLLETVNKILKNQECLDFLSFKAPPLKPINVPPPEQDIEPLIEPIIEKCIEIYSDGIGVNMLELRCIVNNFVTWIQLDNEVQKRLDQVTSEASQYHRSLPTIQGMFMHDFPKNADVKGFLQEIVRSSTRLSEFQQQSMQGSLEYLIARIDDCKEIVNAIKSRSEQIQVLAEGIRYGYDVWQPPSEIAKELGVAMLKICQLMRFCQILFTNLRQLIPKNLQGDWNKKNVLFALRQIKMKFYALSVLKLAQEVASPSASWFGFRAQPPIEVEQLKNMASTLKNLALEDVELTDIEWFTGCQHFTKQCPTKERIEVSFSKAESLFQKVYKGPLMDEKCFLQVLLSCQLKDILY
jgi:hypothetical protein